MHCVRLKAACSSDLGSDPTGDRANLTLQEIAAFVRTPIRGKTMLHDLLDAATGAMWHRCDARSRTNMMRAPEG